MSKSDHDIEFRKRKVENFVSESADAEIVAEIIRLRNENGGLQSDIRTLNLKYEYSMNHDVMQELLELRHEYSILQDKCDSMRTKMEPMKLSLDKLTAEKSKWLRKMKREG